MAYSDSKSSPRLSSREKKTLSEPLLQGESAALAYSDSVREPQQEGGKQNKRGWIGGGGEDASNANSERCQGYGYDRGFNKSVHKERQPFPCFDCNTQEWQEAVSTVDPLADGIPDYVASIRAIGNSVVPICVREAFKMLSGLE